MKLLIVLVAFCFLQSFGHGIAHANNNDGTTNPPVNTQSLEQTRAIFQAESQKLVSSDPSARMGALSILKDLKFNETVVVLRSAFDYHLLYDKLDPEYLSEIVIALKNIINRNHGDLILGLVQNTDYMIGATHPQVNSIVQRKLDEALTASSESDHNVPNLFPVEFEQQKQVKRETLSLSKPEAEKKEIDLLEYTHRVEGYLKENLIGQPEITRAIINSLIQDQIISKRENPDIFYLLGGPGTGKDTAAMLTTNALHAGKGNAHEDHLFQIERMSKEGEIWRLIGSPTGYKGSDGIPPLLRFAMEHSGGRYFLKKIKKPGGTEEEIIMENEKWNSDKQEGFQETDAVVFLNEYHNWSKSAKDALKAFLERGHLTINNPQGNVEMIDFKPKIMIASNEGLEELSSRDRFGRRQGKALDHKSLLEKWELFASDVERIKKSILRANVKGGASDEDAPGISEETLNRIPLYNFLVLRPHSPEGLQKIAELHLKNLAKRLDKSSKSIGAIDLSWSKKVPVFLQEYDYVAEENARPMKDKLNSLIVSTFIEGIRSEKLNLSKDKTKVYIDVRQKKDKSWNLIVKYKNKDQEKETRVSLLINLTKKDIPVKPVSKAQLEEWGQVQQKLNNSVLGIEHITDRLAREIVNAQEEAYINSKTKTNKMRATVFAFFGMSSNGKTETAKVLTEALYGSRDQLTTISFNNINSRHDMREFLLGTKHPDGSVDESQIQAAMKRYNNKVVINLDEIVNLQDPEALKMLYDFFDEPIVTFADGNEEPMGGVTFVITGNVGDQIYKQIPKSFVSKEAQRHLYAQAYDIFMSDPEKRNQLLFSMLPDPLVKRIGLKRIYFFGPLNYQHSRGVAQISLLSVIKKLREGEGSRTWEIKFSSKKDFANLIEAIDDTGFTVDEQGRSIREMIDDQFYVSFKTIMQDNKIPSGTKVWVKVDKRAPKTMKLGSTKYELLRINLHVEGRKDPLKMDLQGTEVNGSIEESKEERMLTAYHEAGHEVVRKVYFEKYTDHGSLSTRPGVAAINGEIVYYAGVAKSFSKVAAPSSREETIRNMAKLAGGYVAEKLVTKGHRHGSGKHNDMDRATQIAYRAIVLGGLSPEWGTETMIKGAKLSEYVQLLPEDRKQLLNRLVKEMLQEAEFLAVKAIRSNFDLLISMGTELAETGEMKSKRLTAFYKKNKVNFEESAGYQNVEFLESDKELFEEGRAPVETDESLFDRLNKKTSASVDSTIDIHFVDEVPRSLEPLDAQEMELTYKKEMASLFVLSEADIPVEKRPPYKLCAELLTD